jgi:hypothetical protein
MPVSFQDWLTEHLVPTGNAVVDFFVAAVLGNEIDPDGFIPG